MLRLELTLQLPDELDDAMCDVMDVLNALRNERQSLDTCDHAVFDENDDLIIKGAF